MVWCHLARVTAAALPGLLTHCRTAVVVATCQWVAHIALFAVTVAVYSSTFGAEFVWDDRAAVVGNMDLRPESPWSDLLQHDFWGQNITLE